MDQPMTYDAFAQEVPRLLRHLQDHVYLQSHPLCATFCPPSAAEGPSQVQTFRRLVLETIDALVPPVALSVESKEWRGYHILTARYIEGRSVEELMAELSISQRQFYREHSMAIEAVVRALWEHYRRHTSETAPPPELHTEAARISGQVEAITLHELVAGVMAAVRNLVLEHGINLETEIAPLPPVVANRTLLRQVFIQTVTHLAQLHGTCSVLVSAQPAGHEVAVEITASGELQAAELAPDSLDLESTASLVRILGGQWLDPEIGSGLCRVHLLLPATAVRVVLVVEDNPSAIQLFERYLAELGGYQVIAAPSGEDALRLVAERRPDVIALDIMLPRQDGWEILQALKANPATSAIPVIIASVLDEARLASSLGASAYLKKPFSQAELVQVLHQLE
jgi:CheY-like chemotaxis protein